MFVLNALDSEYDICSASWFNLRDFENELTCTTNILPVLRILLSEHTKLTLGFNTQGVLVL